MPHKDYSAYLRDEAVFSVRLSMCMSERLTDRFMQRGQIDR